MSLPTEQTSEHDRGGSGGGSTAEGVSAVKRLQKHLICPFCQEVFNKPVVILPCQHNLCRKCASQLYQARTTITVNSGHFRCPSCRQEVLLDRHGVYGLQRNQLVENIIDIYNQELSTNISCVPPPSTPDPLFRCSIHSTERMNIYCLSCGFLTCSLCKVFGVHQSCQVVPLIHIFQQKKEELNYHVKSLIEFNHKIKSVIKELEDACTSIQESSELQKQRVRDKVQQVVLILEGKQKMMTQQLTREQEERTNNIQALVRCYKNSMETNRKLLQQATLSMEEKDLVTFIQNSKEVISNVTKASQCFLPESLEADADRLTDYRYNFSRQERALKSIKLHREHLPKEQMLQYFEELCIQNIKTNHNQDSAIDFSQNHQCLESTVEAAAVISPPEGPAKSDREAATPDILMEPVEPFGMVLTFSEDEPEENKKEEEIQREAHIDPPKEENMCEQEEALNTKQIVTLIFYLFTLLFVLKRVWFYIGCFICT